MDITLAGSGVPYQPSDDDLGGLSIELAAFDGEVGIGQVPMPDPSAGIDVYDGRALRVDEGATRLTDGFIVDQDRDRGPIPAGTAREHTFSAMDANALLDGFRITNRHRPSETDVARVLAFAALDGPDWDTTWVLDVDTVTMPVKVYDADGGWPAELIPDLVEVTGKTLWLHDLTDGSGRCLHYHNLQSGHGCGLSINDGKRYDAGLRADPTVFEPWNPRRQRTSVDLRNDILGRDQKGRTSHATDATSISRHDADGLQHQSLQTFETTGQADLNVKTAAYLASSKDERDTYTLSIGPLDADALALIRNGDIINTTSSVLGLSDSDQRIAHMVLKPWIGEQGTAVPDLWLADLELGAPVRRRGRRAAKAVVDRVTHSPVLDTGIVPAVICENVDTPTGWGTSSVEYQADPTITFFGDIQITMTPNASAVGIDGVSGGFGTAVADVNLVVPDGSVGILSGRLYIPQAVYGPPDFYGIHDSISTPTTEIVLDGASGRIARLIYHLDEDVTFPGVAYSLDNGLSNSGFTHSDEMGKFYRFAIMLDDEGGRIRSKLWVETDPEPSDWDLTVATLPDTTVTTLTFYGGMVRVAAAFTNSDFALAEYVWSLDDLTWCTGIDTGIAVAFHWTQYGPLPVKETPDGSTTTFTLPDYPSVASGGYVHGTLHVFVDGIEQNKTETDPTAGTFTLTWAPTADMQVTASWVVP